MILRILHEGQYRVSGADLDKINEIDNKLVECVAEGDHESFAKLLAQLLDTVRSHGKRLGVDEFVESDVILPAADSSMDEVQELFAGEGMIPG